MSEVSQKKSLGKVLVIAYSFPPMGGGRVRRTIKFIKFLPEFGWEPIVLTVKRPIASEYDYGLLDEIHPRVKIVRTNSFELAFLAKITRQYKNSPLNDNIFFHNLRHKLSRIIKKLKWWVLFPDSRNGWIPFCIWHGWQIIKKEKIDLIYVSAEPFSCLISAMFLKKITGKSLVVDYRDEWTNFSQISFPEKPVIIERLEKMIERAVVGNADKVISVTQPIINHFKNSYPYEKEEKFLCITNGFDPDDFERLPCKRKEGNKLTIVYTGILYRLRTPEYFLRSVEKFLEKEPDFLTNVEIIFIGTIEEPIMDMLKGFTKLKGIIKTLGFLSHKETLRMMMQSDLLLYIDDQSAEAAHGIPGKLFEYMASRKPILALCGGPAEEILKYVGCSKICYSRDIDSIVSGIEYFYYRYKDKRLKWELNMERIMEFSRRNLTEKLSEAFNSCKVEA